MTINVEIGKGLAIAVDDEKLQRIPAVWNHVVYVGLRNLLMDSHAKVKLEDYPSGDDGTKAWRDAARAIAAKKLAAMEAGEIRTNATRTRAADPLETECDRLARVWVHALVSRDGFTFAPIAAALNMPHVTPNDQKALKAEMIRRRATHPDTLAVATANVAAAAKAATSVDLADLGL